MSRTWWELKELYKRLKEKPETPPVVFITAKELKKRETSGGGAGV